MSDLFTVFNDNGDVQLNTYHSHYSLKLPIISSNEYNWLDLMAFSSNRPPASLFFYQVNEPNSYICPDLSGFGSYAILKNNARAFAYRRNAWGIKSKYGLQLFNENGDMVYDACSLPLRIIDKIFDFSASDSMHTFSTRRYSQEIAVCAICLPKHFDAPNNNEHIVITMPDTHTISCEKRRFTTLSSTTGFKKTLPYLSILIADVTGL